MAETVQKKDDIVCLRCQTKLKEPRPFCDDCLQVMVQYPVKPDTVIMLPQRRKTEASKKTAHRKRTPTAEEQVLQLKKLVRRMISCAVLLLVALCLVTAWLIRELKEPVVQQPVGRNYTITTDQTD